MGLTPETTTRISDFAWTWFGHLAIDEPENRWVTGM